jgi:hypothetical protein
MCNTHISLGSTVQCTPPRIFHSVDRAFSPVLAYGYILPFIS